VQVLQRRLQAYACTSKSGGQRGVGGALPASSVLAGSRPAWIAPGSFRRSVTAKLAKSGGGAETTVSIGGVMSWV
jgi:hypothetical protein